jgi:hypothetical protein
MNVWRSVIAVTRSIPSLSLSTNRRQHPHTGPKLRNRNIIEEFMSQLECFCADLADDTLGSSPEMHGLASPIVGGVSARNPAVIFKPM